MRVRLLEMPDQLSDAEQSRHEPSVLVADERALVERIRAGDQAAFDELVLKYYPDLRACAAVFVHSVAAEEELVQDVFLKIWSIRDRWTIQSSLRGYLLGTVRNMALVYRRRERMIGRWEAGAVERGDAPAMGTAMPADARLEASEFSAALRRAIDRLPTRCRQVAILRFEQELSRAEVAEALGVTVKAVERQIARALRVLRVELARYIEDPR